MDIDISKELESFEEALSSFNFVTGESSIAYGMFRLYALKKAVEECDDIKHKEKWDELMKKADEIKSFLSKGDSNGWLRL